MNQQNPNPVQDEAPRRVPTEAEIARAEAEAVAAMLRAKQPADAAEPQSDAEALAAPADFVPYVDDVPEPEPTDGGDDDDDGEYIPGEWEKRIAALTPKQWKLYQIVGGALTGLAAVAALFIFGEELSMYGLIVAALLALLLPRYLERSWRCKLTTARYAMAAAMLAGLIAMGIVMGLRTGFVFIKKD